MATADTVPVHINQEATERIAALGMGREFQEMLDRVRQTVPGLRFIEVTLEYDPCGRDDPGIVIWSHRDEPPPGDDPVDWDYGTWKVTTFPPEVCLHFVMISVYEAPNAG